MDAAAIAEMGTRIIEDDDIRGDRLLDFLAATTDDASQWMARLLATKMLENQALQFAGLVIGKGASAVPALFPPPPKADKGSKPASTAGAGSDSKGKGSKPASTGGSKVGHSAGTGRGAVGILEEYHPNVPVDDVLRGVPSILDDKLGEMATAVSDWVVRDNFAVGKPPPALTPTARPGP